MPLLLSSRLPGTKSEHTEEEEEAEGRSGEKLSQALNPHHIHGRKDIRPRGWEWNPRWKAPQNHNQYLEDSVITFKNQRFISCLQELISVNNCYDIKFDAFNST